MRSGRASCAPGTRRRCLAPSTPPLRWDTPLPCIPLCGGDAGRQLAGLGADSLVTSPPASWQHGWSVAAHEVRDPHPQPDGRLHGLCAVVRRRPSGAATCTSCRCGSLRTAGCGREQGMPQQQGRRRHASLMLLPAAQAARRRAAAKAAAAAEREAGGMSCAQRTLPRWMRPVKWTSTGQHSMRSVAGCPPEPHTRKESRATASPAPSSLIPSPPSATRCRPG